ncbi:BTAD domain-containing putative transcriptional regulator [Streptosporangium sp. NPDC000396]|uniref:AfsR/SARP family transcriptional regulator n=1 Tax=Streptosporangium sp. NPDC000396 TaxID=3366185 RepID=UPI0036BEBC09
MEAVGPRGPVGLQGSVPRTLLARLASRPDECVSREALISALWDDTPPRTALSTLRSHLTRLRRQLDASGLSGLIVADGVAYTISADIDVDARMLEDAARAGRESLSMGDARSAVAAARAGLQLWRGDALMDCRPSSWSQSEVARLTELHLNALESKFQALQLLGEHEAVISELEQLITQYPFREKLWEIMMICYSQAGRRADALAAYQRARSILRIELGIEPGHELQRLQSAILVGEPTLRNLPAVQGPAITASTREPHAGSVLPAAPTSFVGREKELTELAELLDKARLLTLTGVGGVGKSRLAMQLGENLRGRFPDGIWYVDFGVLEQPELILHHLSEVLEIQDRTPRTLLGRLIGRLRGAKALLLFDNCEGLLDACAEAVDALLRSLPQLRVLVTSRQALTLHGECIFTVPPLPTPDATGGEDLAVTLFRDRAEAMVSGFELVHEADIDLASRICRRVEGIPLAIELAAVQLRVLSLQELLQRLDDRFQVLASGHRITPKRHLTLRATIDWSFELCSSSEQELWARLSVFRGSFDLSAAERVCADDEFGHGRFMAALAGLVEKSVLTREEHPRGVRFRMLDSLSEYGRSRLRESGEADLYLARHRDYYLALAEDSDAAWFGPDQLEWLDRLRLERANLRTAFDFCLTSPGESNTGLRLTAALHHFWVGCDFLSEGQYWLGLALASGTAPTKSRTKALWVAARVDYLQGDDSRAQTRLDEAMALAIELGDEDSLTYAIHICGTGALITGDLDSSTELLQEVVERYRSLGGAKSMAVIANIHLAMSCMLKGDPWVAVELCQASLRECAASREQSVLSYGLYVLSCAEFEEGRMEQALEHAQEALYIKFDFLDMVGLAMVFDHLARILVDMGHPQCAALALGGAQQCWNALGEPWFGSPVWREIREQAETACRRDLGDASYESAFLLGFERPLSQVVSSVSSEFSHRARQR